MKEEMSMLMNEVRFGDFTGNIGKVQQGIYARRAARSGCGMKRCRRTF